MQTEGGDRTAKTHPTLGLGLKLKLKSALITGTTHHCITARPASSVPDLQFIEDCVRCGNTHRAAGLIRGALSGRSH